MSITYTSLHNHTHYSLLDSASTPEDYVEKCKEYGMSAIAFTEHGNIYNWIKKKQLCDKNNIKYIHGVEAYVTEDEENKVRDNFHVVLLARNYEGVLEINEKLSKSFDLENIYYKNRISYVDIITLSSNVIVLGGCLGGIFYNSTNARLLERIDYIEIQPHADEEQKKLNLRALASGKKIVATGDFHYTSQYKKECTELLKMTASDSLVYETDWDLEFKSPTSFKEAFMKLGYISEQQIDLAMSESINISNMIEDFKLDESFKYPELYENSRELLHKRVWDKFNSLPIPNKKEAIDRINMELDVMDKMGVWSFMLFMGEMITHCKENDIGVGSARGSAGASYVGYLLGITSFDPMKYNLEFSRFMNPDRVSLMDIDTDFEKTKRYQVFEYIKNRFPIENTAHIISFMQLKSKSIIDVVCRVKNVDLSIASKIKAGHEVFDKEEFTLSRRLEDGSITQYEYDEGMEDLNDRLSKYLSQYDEVFHYYKGLMGVIRATSIHPAGIIAGNNNLLKVLGVKFDKKKSHYVSMCDMKAVDSCNYVKYDILGLNTIDRIFNADRTIKIPDIDDTDLNVYNSLYTSPIGLFQFESMGAFSALKKFQPKSIEEIALVSAVIRPSCASFREDILSRKFNTNPDQRIDDLLRDTYGYLVYQEQQIEFLKSLCGFTAGQADLVRRAIGKKDEKLLATLIPKIELGYVEHSPKNREDAMNDIRQYMQVFIDSAMYSFNKAHAVAYSIMTYLCGYTRFYKKEAFVASFLNSSTSDDDIINGTNLANVLGIKIFPAKFGKARADYAVYSGEIYKGVASIVNLSSEFAEQLYNISQSYKFDSFVDVINKIYSDCTAKNTTKIETLIRVNYFSDFGTRKKLLTYFALYQKYGKSKIISKDGLSKVMDDILNELQFTSTAKTYKVESSLLMTAIWDRIPSDIELTDDEIIIDELSFLNYIQSDVANKDNIGQVSWSGSTKRGNTILVNRSWYTLGESLGTLPKKGDYIKFSATKGKIVSYKTLTLKRNKRG